MERQPTVLVAECCEWYKIEVSFIQALEQHGLLQIMVVDDRLYLETEQLPVLEKYTRLHYDMDINLEGIETVAHLLNQVQRLQQEIMQLRNQIGG